MRKTDTGMLRPENLPSSTPVNQVKWIAMFLDSLKWSSECQRATAVLFPDEIFLKDGTTRLKGIHRYHFEVVFHKFLSFILSAPKSVHENRICCRNGCQVWECQDLGWEAWCTGDGQLLGLFCLPRIIMLCFVLHFLASPVSKRDVPVVQSLSSAFFIYSVLTGSIKADTTLDN